MRHENKTYEKEETKRRASPDEESKASIGRAEEASDGETLQDRNTRQAKTDLSNCRRLPEDGPMLDVNNGRTICRSSAWEKEMKRKKKKMRFVEPIQFNPDLKVESGTVFHIPAINPIPEYDSPTPIDIPKNQVRAKSNSI